MRLKNEDKVCIVIVNFNGDSDTIECIKSIREKEGGNSFKIVLIDNGSKTFNQALIQRLFPDIEVILNGKNLGFSGGINIGINMSVSNGYKYTLLINNDTVVTKNFLSKLVSTLDKHSKCGIVAPLITYYSNSDLVWFRGGSFDRCSSLVRHLDMNKNKNNFAVNKPFETEFISGCCMLVRNSVFDEIGVWDEDYFLYDEDLDFCFKTKAAGFSLMINPESEILHKVSASTVKGGNVNCDPHQFSKTKAYYWPRSDLMFIKKNLKGVCKWTSFFSHFVIKFPYFGFYLLRKKMFVEFKTYLKGIWDGIKF